MSPRAQDAQLGPRITHLIFVSNDLRDQIVVAGAADYRLNVGGTGAFVGVRGEVATTRLSTGGYRQDFTLLR